MKYVRLGDLLIDAGAITEEQLEQALALQKDTHQRLGETLVSAGIISERQLIEALEAQLGVEYIDLTNVEIDPAMTKLVSKGLAKKHRIVPVALHGNELYLAMADPLDYTAMEEAREFSRKRIVPMIGTQSGVDHAISVLYGTEGARRAIRDMQKENEADGLTPGVYGTTPLSSEIGADAEGQMPSVRLVDNIIERGISERASDIHIEPQEDEVRVRMRVDGVLHEELTVPKELQQSLISRVKVMCDMDVTERRVPQDGRAIVRLRAREADLRVSTLPTVNGEKVVIRILDRAQQLETPEELGFYGHNLEEYTKLLESRQGVILLVGPTGSGKSSTMLAMLTHLNTDEVNIITLEDPVEYNIPGVTQVRVDERAGLTFANGLRAALRQDPDVISVGEIRDAETADIAMRAAMTGHLVISTIHANSAVDTADRLSDIGVAPYMQAAALRGVINQRLVRRICPHCKEAYNPTHEERALVADDVKLYRGKGCPECLNTGYLGRSVVAEVLLITPEIRRAIRSGSHDDLVAAVDATGFQPITENARDLVLKGTTTLEEALRAVSVIE